jgi:hypothetical protein
MESNQEYLLMPKSQGLTCLSAEHYVHLNQIITLFWPSPLTGCHRETLQVSSTITIVFKEEELFWAIPGVEAVFAKVFRAAWWRT